MRLSRRLVPKFGRPQCASEVLHLCSCWAPKGQFVTVPALLYFIQICCEPSQRLSAGRGLSLLRPCQLRNARYPAARYALAPRMSALSPADARGFLKLSYHAILDIRSLRTTVRSVHDSAKLFTLRRCQPLFAVAPACAGLCHRCSSLAAQDDTHRVWQYFLDGRPTRDGWSSAAILLGVAPLLQPLITLEACPVKP